MMLQGTAQVGLVSPNKFKNFQIFWLTLPYLIQQRKDALKYLVHFVGDVYQPLHLGNKKDRGGGTLRFP